MSRTHSLARPHTPVVLQARGVSFEIDGTTVLADVDCTVAPGSVLGIVGPNGVGKSTLLRLMAGLDDPTDGTITTTPPDATIALLAQEPERPGDESVSTTLARRTGVARAQAELDQTLLAVADESDRAAERYDAALERWLGAGGADFDARAEATLADTGASPDLLQRPTAVLSGGEAARVALAAILLTRVDVLLLDEPSNNLDLDGLARLERFLREERAGGTVLVSHDRVLLERVVTDVLELHEHHRTAVTYGGGWSTFQREKAADRRNAETDYDEYQAERSRLRDRAQTQHEWSDRGLARAKTSSSDGDKHIRNRRIARSEKRAAKARATEQAMARLEPVEKPWEGWDLRYAMATAARSGDDVAELVGATASLGDFTLGPVDLLISAGERIALVGPNGSGKTTLLGMLLGTIELQDGRRRLGPSVVVGELDQRRLGLDPNRSVADAFARRCDLTASAARSVLAKFGLSAGHVGRRSDTLSPGERTRAQLAEFAVRGVNLLVLDEPTNHLDLPAIEQLEQALVGYDGTLLLVTHDRAMLDSVTVTRTIRLPLTPPPT